MHERDSVTAHPFVHEVGRDEDCHTLISRKIDQQFPEAIPSDWIDTRRWLIKNQQFRRMQNRDRQREPLTQTHRQIPGQRIEMRAQAEFFDQLLDARFRLVSWNVIEASIQDQVLADGQLSVE